MKFKRNVSAKVQDTKNGFSLCYMLFSVCARLPLCFFSSPFSICLQVLEFLKDYFFDIYRNLYQDIWPFVYQ